MATRWLRYILWGGLGCAVMCALLWLRPFVGAVFRVFDSTTITFKNGQGRPCRVDATIIEPEHGNREGKYRFVLAPGDAKTIGVEHGVKTVRVSVGDESGEIHFDQWNGEDVVLWIRDDGSLVQDFQR